MGSGNPYRHRRERGNLSFAVRKPRCFHDQGVDCNGERKGPTGGIRTAPSASVDHGAAPDRAAEGYCLRPQIEPHETARAGARDRNPAAPCFRGTAGAGGGGPRFSAVRFSCARSCGEVEGDFALGPRLKGSRGRSLTLPSPKAVARVFWQRSIDRCLTGSRMSSNRTCNS